MPTKELAEQVTQHLKQLTVYLDQEVTLANAASGTTTHLQRSPFPLMTSRCGNSTPNSSRTIISEKPDIVVATPSRILTLLQSKVRARTHTVASRANSPQTASLELLESLAIDEADLIFSYGHDEDIRHIFGGRYLPKVFQSYLMSATMTEDVEALKGLTLRNPVGTKPFRLPVSYQTIPFVR